MPRRPLLLLVLGLLLTACSKPKAEPAPSPSASHASTSIKPGTYEDWCEEHQVPESQCTRCNPKLAAAFKASGDWCEEHGLPESHCTKCNPNLKIPRPPKSTGN